MSRAELWVSRLSASQRPKAFLEVLKELASIPDDVFFNDPAYKPLYEAWAAGHFALGFEQLYNHVEVRLELDRFPDFHLRVSGREYDFEYTTTDKPERKRGKEYKERRKTPLLLTPYQPARGQQAGPLWVAEAIRRKHKKRYSTHPHLLVYANFEANRLDPLTLAAACRQWSASFSSIWVLWSYRFVQLFDSEAFGKADHAWRSVDTGPWA